MNTKKLLLLSLISISAVSYSADDVALANAANLFSADNWEVDAMEETDKLGKLNEELVVAEAKQAEAIANFAFAEKNVAEATANYEHMLSDEGYGQNFGPLSFVTILEVEAMMKDGKTAEDAIEDLKNRDQLYEVAKRFKGENAQETINNIKTAQNKVSEAKQAIAAAENNLNVAQNNATMTAQAIENIKSKIRHVEGNIKTLESLISDNRSGVDPFPKPSNHEAERARLATSSRSKMRRFR